MNRGLNRRRIFHDEAHRLLFLDLLKERHERYGVQTLAYCLMGRPDWLYCDEVLGRCSGRMLVKDYEKYVEEGIDENSLKIFSKTKLPSVLGGKEWMEEIKTEYLAEKIIDDEVPELKGLMADYQPENIFLLMKNVAHFYKVPLNKLGQRGHRHAENMPRNRLIYLASKEAI